MSKRPDNELILFSFTVFAAVVIGVTVVLVLRDVG